MACSIRLTQNFITNRIIQRSRHLPCVFFDNRHFCSKDGDVKEKSASSDEPSKETNTKKKSFRVKKKEPKVLTEEMKAAAKEKLKSLLFEIAAKPDSASESKSALNLAKAVKRMSKKERLKELQDKLLTPEKQMKMAVQAIASSFESNAEKVESEITDKLDALNLTKKTSTEEEEKEEAAPPKKTEAPLIDEALNTTLMSSVEEVAATISEQPIPSRSELTQRLMRLSLNQKIKSDKTMKSVIQGMVIKSRRSAALERKAESGASERIMMKRTPVRKFERVNIFGGTPLNIFTPGEEPKPESSNTFWQKLEEKELRLLTQFAPANAFEEMIMWTEQGKHWKLPIDNEIEMGAEEKVGFHEHVFLEQHLAGFPTKGPIRHFMELVCVGLSKNPHLTVERKKANIEWFRSYFKEKEELLKETGAIE